MIASQFEVEGVRYVMDRWGVVRQADLSVTQTYDLEYVRVRYDALPDHGRAMSYLRAGFIIGALRSIPGSILDFGYGNGDFLAVMRDYGCECYGYDISGYPLPKGVYCSDWASVVNRKWGLMSFFDSLEHLESIDFLAALQAYAIVVTAPYMPLNGNFASWKHRRPGEHLRHFTPMALTLMMRDYGYRLMVCRSLEDVIRKSDRKGNTFTAVYRKC
jgi:hypothetical protein